MVVQVKRWALSVFISVFGVLGVVWVGSIQAGELVVTDAYTREMPPGVMTSAVYLVITNSSDKGVVLVGVASTRASKVMVHQNTLQDDMMRMRPVTQLEIAAHSQFDFAPGGHHLMIMGLSQPLQAGETLDLVFRFDDGQVIDVLVPVTSNTDSSEYSRLHKSKDMKVQN